MMTTASPTADRRQPTGVGRWRPQDLLVRDPADDFPADVGRPDAPLLMFVASNGGHLAQLMSLQNWWHDRPRIWVSFDKLDAQSRLAGERTVWAHWPTTRNIPNLVRNTVLAIKTLRRERPDVIVSTGAAVALPFFAVACLMRIPRIYIEVYDRMDTRTLSGRLCRPLATQFLVQWPEQQSLYRGSTLVGPLL